MSKDNSPFEIIHISIQCFVDLKKRQSATPSLLDVRSAEGGQVLARLWRVERSMFDVHYFFHRLDRLSSADT